MVVGERTRVGAGGNCLLAYPDIAEQFVDPLMVNLDRCAWPMHLKQASNREPSYVHTVAQDQYCVFKVTAPNIHSLSRAAGKYV
jgi:hypothetical protein